MNERLKRQGFTLWITLRAMLAGTVLFAGVGMTMSHISASTPSRDTANSDRCDEVVLNCNPQNDLGIAENENTVNPTRAAGN